MKRPLYNEFDRWCIRDKNQVGKRINYEIALKKFKRSFEKTKAFQLLRRLLSSKKK